MRSFSEIYEAYAQDMFTYGLCFTNNRDLVKDCIHEVFIHLFEKRNILEHEHLKFYLIRSMRNEILRAFRDAKETHPVEEAELAFTPVYSVEDEYIQKEQEATRQRDIQEMMSHLTPNQRQAIYHRYIDEFSIQQIADIMNIHYQSVQNLLQRSIKKIKDIYNKQRPGEHAL